MAGKKTKEATHLYNNYKKYWEKVEGNDDIGSPGPRHIVKIKNSYGQSSTTFSGRMQTTVTSVFGWDKTNKWH